MPDATARGARRQPVTCWRRAGALRTCCRAWFARAVGRLASSCIGVYPNHLVEQQQLTSFHGQFLQGFQVTNVDKVWPGDFMRRFQLETSALHAAEPVPPRYNHPPCNMKTSAGSSKPLGPNSRSGSEKQHSTETVSLELSVNERERLHDYEEVIDKGLETFFDVGTALLAIRDARLYRGHYTSFESYCRERWGFGRLYAWRVIGAAQRLKLLPEDAATAKPNSEFQMRPFLKLKPEVFPQMWKQVIERAHGEKITSELIGGLIEEICGNPKAKDLRNTRPGKVCLRKGTVGEILMLLNRMRRGMETDQNENALADLDRIERLLIQPN